VPRNIRAKPGPSSFGPQPHFGLGLAREFAAAIRYRRPSNDHPGSLEPPPEPSSGAPHVASRNDRAGIRIGVCRPWPSVQPGDPAGRTTTTGASGRT